MKRPSPTPFLLAGALAYGLLILALLPQGVIAMNDDFAYLRSVVETLQHGRLWTNDWLEPWAAGLTLLSVGAYKATGSFYASTMGVLALYAAAAVYLLSRLLVERGLGALRAWVVSVVILTTPTLLWKQVQFTGLALYLPCLLGALWAAERRRWGWFALCWALGMATRQSALGWAALPLGTLVLDAWPVKSRESFRLPRAPIAVLTGGFLLYAVLGLGMNKTFAQAAITDHMWQAWNWRQAMPAILIGAVALLFAVGTAVWSAGAASYERLKQPCWRWAAVLAAASLLLSFQVRDFVACEFDALDISLGRNYAWLLAGLGLLGFLIGNFRWRLLPLAGAAAALAALTFRGVIWDYYLLDVCVFGFFAISPVATEPKPGFLRWLPRLALAAIVSYHALNLLRTKSNLDRTHVMFDLGSRALEEGKLDPSKASFLPFGLMAWYYFPLHMQQSGTGPNDVADFGRYLEQDTVLIAWRFSRPLRGLAEHDGSLPHDPDALIVQGKFNYCWFYGCDVMLLRAPPGKARPARVPYPAGYALPTFPRDDAGWRKLIGQETGLAAPPR